MIVPVIMAGGAGTRLWPMSNEEKPKQFHNLSGKGSLLHETIERLKPLNPEEIVIVTSKKYEALSMAEIKSSGMKGTVLSEPEPKNTSAAVLYSAIYLQKKYGNPTMIMLPADHYIKKPKIFAELLSKAAELATEEALVTMGVEPTYAETGYGYIKAVSAESNEVEKFVEKPDRETAEKYFKSGLFYWNSGIFSWQVKTVLNEIQRQLPELYREFLPLSEKNHEEIASNSSIIWALKKEIFQRIQSISIDYGILENASKRMVIPGDFGWADLGSWASMDDVLVSDENGNRSNAEEKSIFIKTKNSSVFSKESNVALVGVNNVVVVHEGDNILVISKDHAQDVREVVDEIKKRNL